jgi:2-polyprenyl-3-methyl-5-hydroxy-6-metoxy-1,4-benzoquinol methylase
MNLMQVECPICHMYKCKLVFKEMFDDRFGCPVIADIYSCSDCSHYFCDPALTEDKIGPLYEEFYGRSETTELGVHRSLLSPFLRWILGENNLGQFEFKNKIGKTLLDVGSGDCQNLWDAAQLGYKCYGYDVDSASRAIGTKYGLDVRSGKHIADVYGGFNFDYVQLNQVIEHLIHPQDQLRAIGSFLAKDGQVFISTPNSMSFSRFIFGRRWINWHVPYHQHHFSRKSLRQLAVNEGFEISRFRTVTPLVWLLLQLRNIQSTSTPGVPNLRWTISSTRRGSRVFELAALALLFVPIRLIDKFGFGDSQVVILTKKS